MRKSVFVSFNASVVRIFSVGAFVSANCQNC